MNSPLMNWLSKARPKNKPYNPNANALPFASGFMDFMQRNGARWNPQPRQQAPVAQPPGQQAPAPQPMAAQAPVPQQTSMRRPAYMYGSYSDASPTGQAAGNNATASGINSTAEAVAQGLGIATGLAGIGLGAPGIGGLSMGINALGLNDLNVPGVQVNNELSTNNPQQDISAIQTAMNDHFSDQVGRSSMDDAMSAVADGSSSGSQSGQAGTGADGSGGNMGDPGGEGNGGTYRKGGLIPKDKDKKLEARKVTAHEGEFVLRPEAVKAIGSPFLHWLNARR
jgi:hypothetical protein